MVVPIDEEWVFTLEMLQKLSFLELKAKNLEPFHQAEVKKISCLQEKENIAGNQMNNIKS